MTRTIQGTLKNEDISSTLRRERKFYHRHMATIGVSLRSLPFEGKIQRIKFSFTMLRFGK